MKLSERHLHFGEIMKNDPRMIEGRRLYNERAQRKHGLRNSPEYNIWRGIKKRCLLPTCPSYRYYGAKGVTICKEWCESFAAFYRDIGPRPSPSHSLDRWPNSHGNYEPGNIRWATDTEQNRNRPGFNHVLEFEGQQRSVAEWAELKQIPAQTLYKRIEFGWPVRRALAEPARVYRKTIAWARARGEIR